MATKSQIQFVRALQSRKTRDELGLFLAEGPKLVEELLQAPNVQVQDVFATPDWVAAHAAAVRARGGNTVEITDQELHRLSALSAPNQVVAVFTKPSFRGAGAAAAMSEATGFTLVLDGLQDPGNLGTIIRCADWFGVRQVICGPGTADAFNPKVIQSTMGSITRIPVRYETDLPACLQRMQAAPGGPAHHTVYAATLAGPSLYDTPAVSNGCLIIGNEARGISNDVLAQATAEITIPRRGRAESLNAAVATGIILSHLLR